MPSSTPDTGCGTRTWMPGTQRDALIAAGYRLWDATLDAGDEKGTAARAYAETAQRFSETNATVVLGLHHSRETAEVVELISAYMSRQAIPSGTSDFLIKAFNAFGEVVVDDPANI